MIAAAVIMKRKKNEKVANSWSRILICQSIVVAVNDPAPLVAE